MIFEFAFPFCEVISQIRKCHCYKVIKPYWGDPTERKEKKTVQFLILKMFSFLIRENLENTKRRNKRKNPL